MVKARIKLATRKSPLALWQANAIKQQLSATHTELEVELVPMSTQGDTLGISWDNANKSIFLQELEIALIEGRADIAVHSMKDMPMELPPDLHLAAICQRADPSDAFISNHYISLAELPKQATLGTSSLRRKCQIKSLRPDLKVLSLRGNVNSRLESLDRGDYDAIILASAGLDRLQLSSRIRQRIPVSLCVPAAGQGALGIEIRADDVEMQHWVSPLRHEASSQCIGVERNLCQRLGGNCQVPIGAYASIQSEQICLRAIVGDEAGNRLLKTVQTGSRDESQSISTAAAEELLQQGAASILSHFPPQSSWKL